MSKHSIYIEPVYAEDLFDFPQGVHIYGASFEDGRVRIDVDSEMDLGHPDLDALYGSDGTDRPDLHLGMLEPRK